MLMSVQLDFKNKFSFRVELSLEYSGKMTHSIFQKFSHHLEHKLFRILYKGIFGQDILSSYQLYFPRLLEPHFFKSNETDNKGGFQHALQPWVN
jgi:hypothetical protein